ncbi:unnamed protein product [Bathycoccus prasinos]
MADTKKRKDISSLEKRKPRGTNDESFDDFDDLDDGKISNKATKISDAEHKHLEVEQIVLKAKLESKARLKYAHATDNELCEPKRDGPEVNFPTSKEEYEELRQRHSKAAAKTTTTKEDKEEEEEEKDEEETTTTKWVQSYDQTQEEFYYFNPQTRETRWEEPEETTIKIVRDESALAEHKKRELFASVSKEELEEIEREARGEIGGSGRAKSPPSPTGTSVVAANAPQMGWEYEDDSGNWQGPFQTEQLQMWRAALPMNLKVRQHGTTKKESDECTSLALLLGDAHLRKRCEALGAVLPLRCTAVEAEQVMMAAIAARDRIAKENLNGLASDDGDEDDEGEDKKNNGIEKPNRWAQAALEGLPENDRIEQEKIAMENATGVRSSARIDANDEGEDASERFASVGTYNKVTGRVTAEVNELLQRRRAAGPPGGAGAAYRNIGLENYIDPAKMDEAMREIQKARHQKLSRTEIEKRKARKKEMKKKHGDNWLREDWAD